MKITSAEFIKSAYSSEHWTSDGRYEIAFLGRSNVGKSSLINTLLNRKGLARTSNTPGRTQCINFFLVNGKFYFVDLPGYGYAKVSKAMRADWGKMAEEYLANRNELVLFIQLVDSRHVPTQLDRQLHEWLSFNQKNHIVVATKADKLKPRELEAKLREASDVFPETKIFSYSSTTKKGRDDIWREINSALIEKK